MSYTVTQESLDSLATYWTEPGNHLNWNPIFVTPLWLKVWWQAFRSEAEVYLGVVRQGTEVIGIAPLLLQEGKAAIIGSTDVCDYLDFIVVPGMEADFFRALLDDLYQRGVKYLDLKSLRPDSTVITSLIGLAQNLGYRVQSTVEDVSYELELPPTWEEYLAELTSKQRHEVRRKLRRLTKEGRVNSHFVKEEAAVRHTFELFLKMFTESRKDKALFLTAPRESFFRLLVDAMAEAGLLRFGVLELDGLPLAITMCFDYNNYIYLYNSGYDPQYDSLSAGLICKVLCIQNSIEEGKKGFDFLKGDEAYKQQLGGKAVPLLRCQMAINGDEKGSGR